jgi:hypothetical protein
MRGKLAAGWTLKQGELMFTYEGRIFRSVENSAGGDVGGETTFHYHQYYDLVWATYSGGSVRFGTLIASVDAFGNLDMRYQHISLDGSFKPGRCQSRRQWTDGAEGQGISIIEEIPKV